MAKVWLDAGHGGLDPGAVDPAKNDAIYTEEADRNLDMALKCGAALKRCGITVGYSRTTDATLSLQQRVAKANEWGADLFLSWHCNGGPDGSTARGIEVFSYYTSTAGERLAKAVYGRLDDVSPWADRGTKKAGFYVLKYTRMAAALIEAGFINNTQEEAALNSPAYRLTLAEAGARGVCDYLGVTYKKDAPQAMTYHKVEVHTSAPEVASYLDLAKKNNDWIRVTQTARDSFKTW